jgi:hypothetical protein
MPANDGVAGGEKLANGIMVQNDYFFVIVKEVKSSMPR